MNSSIDFKDLENKLNVKADRLINILKVLSNTISFNIVKQLQEHKSFTNLTDDQIITIAKNVETSCDKLLQKYKKDLEF